MTTKQRTESYEVYKSKILPALEEYHKAVNRDLANGADNVDHWLCCERP